MLTSGARHVVRVEFLEPIKGLSDEDLASLLLSWDTIALEIEKKKEHRDTAVIDIFVGDFGVVGQG